VLAHAGWVDMTPRIGAAVHTPSAKEMEDFLWVRTVVKQEAARLAALHANNASVAELRRLVARGMAASASGDQRASAELNSLFHERVDVLTDNLTLQEVLALLKKRLTWYFAPVARLRGTASWAELEHLVDALERGNADAAAAAMREHCENTAAVCRDFMVGVPATI
jgi:DNA-binding GntR family transcriptional regulator